MRLRFPSTPAAAGDARRAVTVFASSWFAADALHDIERAVGEALANSVEHGHRDGAVIRLSAHVDGARFVVDIKDGGEGFTSYRTRRPPSPEPLAPRGYGLSIMNDTMDVVRYSERGTRVRLVKYLTTDAAGAPRREEEA